VKAVLFVERFAQSLGSLRRQSGRRIKLDDALLSRAGNEIVNGRRVCVPEQTGNHQQNYYA
jgi:hypothetical protein